MRAVVYARFSSDLQRNQSLEDQIRLCKKRIKREGWRLVSIDRAQLLFDRDGERRTIAVAAAPARSGVNPQLATSASKSSDDDDDDSSSSNSSSNNSNDDDDDDDN